MDVSQVEVYNKEVAELRAQRDADYAEYEAAGRIWGKQTNFRGLNSFLPSI